MSRNLPHTYKTSTIRKRQQRLLSIDYKVLLHALYMTTLLYMAAISHSVKINININIYR